MQKKKINVFKVFLLIFIIMYFIPLFAVEVNTQPVDLLSEQVTKLKNQLSLDDSQTTKLREILEKEQATAAANRETFKNNALKLTQAAYDRKKEKETQIEALLNPIQKEKFKEISKMSRFDRDLFELTEGLLLNDEQTFIVEGILIDYYNKVKEIIPEERWSDEEVGPDMSMQTPIKEIGAQREFGLMKRMIKSFERKKDKAIEKVLTPGQEILFEQIQKDRSMRRNRNQGSGGED